jgi:hypothetical protein
MPILKPHAAADTPVPVTAGRNQWTAASYIEAGTSAPTPSSGFNSADLSAFSNRTTQLFFGTSPDLVGEDADVVINSRPYLVVCRNKRPGRTGPPNAEYTANYIYNFRRGRFIPAGTSYFLQKWAHAPASSDIATYSAGTTYAAGALVKQSGGIYSSRHSGNVGNTPSFSGRNSNAHWKRSDVPFNVPGALTLGLTAWDAFARFRRYLKPVIVEVSCTPDVAVNIAVPTAEEIWCVADKITDFPVEYPYEVTPAEEIALRAVMSNSVGRAALAALKTNMETTLGIVTAVSKFSALDEVSAAARVATQGIKRPSGGGNRPTIRQHISSDI